MSRKMKNSQLFGLGFGLTVLGLVPLPQFGVANVMIISPNPRAVVLREGSSNPKPAIYLMWLNNGDLVKPDSETALEVICDDGKVRTVESGEFVGLPTICPRAVRNTGSTFDSRGEDDFLKYLDLRFYTVTLLDAKQVIRWQDVNGATGYRVKLGTRRETLLDRQVDCPKVSYGGNKPLKLGVEYDFLISKQIL